jgi:hypothetical protein
MTIDTTNRNANAFASTFYFFADTQINAKKIKRACKPTHGGQCKLDRTELRPKRTTTANSTLAIGGVSSPLDSFVVAESSVLRTNFCAEKPAHRQSAIRYKS